MITTIFPLRCTIILLLQLMVSSTHGSLRSEPLSLFNDDPGNCDTIADVWDHDGNMVANKFITHFVGGRTWSASLVAGKDHKSCLPSPIPFVWVGQSADATPASDIKFFNHMVKQKVNDPPLSKFSKITAFAFQKADYEITTFESSACYVSASVNAVIAVEAESLLSNP
jgi:hypothetical protein